MSPLDVAALAAVIGILSGALVALRLATMQELRLAREIWGEGKHEGVLPELQEELDGRWEKRAEAVAARTGTPALEGGAHRC